MWTRSELKTNAKSNLRGLYWIALLVTVIYIGIESVGATFASIIPGLGTMAFALLVMPPLEVGMYRWFSRNREAAAKPSIEQMFTMFKGDAWGNTVGSMLWMYLFLFLWSLIFIIPYIIMFIVFMVSVLMATKTGSSNFDHWSGSLADISGLVLPIIIGSVILIALYIPVAVKYYSYRLTPWILSDNPQIGYQRSLKLSIDLTRGHKWRMFVLDLSFLGWWLLGLLACGIGILFVYPYYLATQSELYATLRHSGVSSGLCTMEELGFIPAGQSGL